MNFFEKYRRYNCLIKNLLKIDVLILSQHIRKLIRFIRIVINYKIRKNYPVIENGKTKYL